MSRYEILDGETVINTIISDAAFVEAHHPGAYRMVPEPEPTPFTWNQAGPEYQWIEVGSFYDRFGPAKIPVLASTDPTAQALVRDTQIRKYIDLARPDVQQFIQYLGTVVPEVTPEVQAAVLSPRTTDNERYQKGLPQPEDDL
ncbi:hypothetical protein ACMHYJ_10070 [Castellaniella hirudinis]|uniref:hypothetical protein n=1 Tax=Castellaniella hirudinis TaxID=1144617 RepID=UPI0039C0254C